MRLLGIEFEGQPWIAVETPDGARPVALLEDFYANLPASLNAARSSTAACISGASPANLIPRSAKVLCAGLNYQMHAAEAGRDLPEQPDVFARWASTVVPDGSSVPVPLSEPGLDWEGELAAIIGEKLYRATPEEVEVAVLGYACFNDLSARVHQRATKQWAIGKNADKSGPLGPVVVTTDEITDPYSLRLRTLVDGQVMQDAMTSEMLFRVGRIGAYASEVMTLMPGDVICTGTPKGVGAARKPPVYITSGQRVEVEIESIGTLTTYIS